MLPPLTILRCRSLRAASLLVRRLQQQHSTAAAAATTRQDVIYMLQCNPHHQHAGLASMAVTVQQTRAKLGLLITCRLSTPYPLLNLNSQIDSEYSAQPAAQQLCKAKGSITILADNTHALS
jgi:hypothetical protein